MSVPDTAPVVPEARSAPGVGQRALVLWGAALVVAYVVTGVTGLRLAALEPATIIWAPSGIALAALVVIDRRLWPAVWLGALLVNLNAGVPAIGAAGIASGNTLSAVVGAWILSRFRFNRGFERIRDALLLLLVSTLAPFVSASIGTLSVAMTKSGAPPPVGLWRDWHLGDMVGIVVVAPAVMTVLPPSRRFRGRNSVLDAIVTFSITLVDGAVLFFLRPSSSIGFNSGAFLTLPALLWGAMRLGPAGSALQALLLCALALVGTLLDRGPFGGWSQPDLGLRWLGIYMSVAAGGALVIAAGAQERRSSEEALRSSEAELADMFESASIGMRWTDAQGVIVRANRAELEMHGYSADEYVGRAASEFHLDPAASDEIVRRVRRGEIIRGRPIRLRHRDGSVRDALLDASARFEDGRFVAARFFTRDVTASLQAESLRARLAAIVESSQDAILSMDFTGLILSWNRGAERIFGYPASEIVGRHISVIIPPEMREEAAQTLARAASGDRVETFESRRVARSGARLDVAITISPLRDGAGRIIGLSKALRDITDRTRAEARLGLEHAVTKILASRASLEEAADEILGSVCHFLDADIACLWALDEGADALRPAAIFTKANDPALAQFIAVTRATRFERGRGLPGRVWETLAPAWIADLGEDANFPRAEAAALGGLRSGAGFPALTADRLHAVVEWFSRDRLELDDPLMGMMSAVGSEIGQFVQRRRAEAAHIESEARFRTLAESAPVLIWRSGLDAKCVYFNAAWLEFTGRTLEQEMGDGWAEGVHPDDLDRRRSIYTDAFAARRPFSMEYRLRRHDGEHRWIVDHGVPLITPEGEFGGFLGSCIDITDRMRVETALRENRDRLEGAIRERTRELEEAHQRLHSTERMASLGSLSAGIGHDMSNLLLPLRIRLDALERGVAPEQREDIAAIRSCADYLQGLASALRMLAHDPDAVAEQGQVTEPSVWWDEAKPMIRTCVPKGVGFESRITPDLPSLALPPHRLTQAVFNLVQNAARAVQHAQAPRIVVEAGPAEPGWAVVRVRDNGQGMTEEVRRRCFEPFFSTKTRGLSTGLGLSLVAGIVERAKGRIELESRPGAGACFTLFFRTADTPGDARSPDAAHVTIADARDRSMVVSLLEGLGVPASVSEPGEEPNGAVLWIADAEVDLDRVRRFLDADPRRRAVIRGGQTNGGVIGAPVESGIVELRRALSDALASSRLARESAQNFNS